MCDEAMLPCPPMPGNGINITVSIDLGSFIGEPCPPQSPWTPQCPPSTSLTKMPCPPKAPMDPNKTICFLDETCEEEQDGFKKAKKNAFSKFGGKDVDKSQKDPSKKDEEEECEEE